MNKFTPRVRLFIFIGLALLAQIVLAASLGALQFSQGKPIPTNLIGPQIVDSGTTTGLSRWLLIIFRIAMIFAWTALPLFIIYLILNKEARKRFLRDMIAFLPILLILLALANAAQNSKRTEGQEGAPGFQGQLTPEIAGTPYPLPEYTAPPPWITTFTTVVIALGVALLIGGVVMMVLRRGQKRLEPLRRFEEEAQAALDSIQSGGDLRDAILRCYYQMIAAIDEYRGIRRAGDITPHEFEIILQQRGLPGGPVHDLTQLFEQVRYGGHTPGRSEERTAVSSLSAIISACQRTRGEL